MSAADIPIVEGIAILPDGTRHFVFKTRSSHVRTYESCARKWFLNEVCGLPDKDTPAKAFGTEMHLILEHWLRDGKVPGRTPEAQAAKRSIPLLPAPGAGLLVEHKIERVLADGTIYTGAIDVADMRPKEQLLSGKVGAGDIQIKQDGSRTEGLKSVKLRLFDHKSTASLQYAKTPDELRRDVSAVAYGMEVRRLVREMFGVDEEEIHGRWNYVPRLGNTPAMPVEFTITRADQRERWAMTLGSVKTMRTYAEQKPKWQDVTPNYDACGNYGGCQFRAQCALAKARTASGNTVNNAPQEQKESTMGLLDDLKNKLPVGQGVAAPAAQAAPAAAPTAAKPAASSTSPLQALLARKKSPTVAAIVAAVPTPPTPEPAEEQPDEAEVQSTEDPNEAEDNTFPAYDAEGQRLEEGVSVGINPPEAPPPDLLKDTVEKRKRTKRTKTLEVVEHNGPQPPQSASTSAVPEPIVSATPPSAPLEPETGGVEFRAVGEIVAALRQRALAFADPTKTQAEQAVALAWFAAAQLIERGDL